MAITRAALADRQRRIELSFPGTDDTLTIWYKPEAWSPRSERAFRDEQKRQTKEDPEADATGYNVWLLTAVIDRWDLLIAAGKPETVPITMAAIEDLGWETQRRLVEKILADMRPNELTPPSSGTGSAVAVNGAAPPTGSFA